MTGGEFRRRALAVLFPERCIYCGRVIPPCRPGCADCLEKLPRIEPPVCRFCGHSRADCTCGRRRRHYDRCAAPFYYEGPAKQAVLFLKEEKDPHRVEVLADEMAAVVRREYGDIAFDGVVPVPMTEAELKARGYNQSLLLAAALNERLDLPLWQPLVKQFETAPQKSLPAMERSGNVLGAFDLKAGWNVEGASVLLADDVVTTGSTVEECAKILKIYGAAEVYVVSATASRLSKDED